MSARSATAHHSHGASRPLDQSRRIANIRAALALAWAAAVIIAVGSDVPTTASELAAGVAALLASYPLIDVVASIAGARYDRTSRNVLRVNAAISTAAVVAIAVAGFGSDAGATLASFGAWAAISGALQFGIAIHRRRSRGNQLPMIISGGLSTIAGLGFIAQSGGNDAHLTYIGGYITLGALLYFFWAPRRTLGPGPPAAQSEDACGTGGLARRCSFEFAEPPVSLTAVP
jgi:uncharacterized membrane protein HdeD (DUF308 family)